jgi:hypothetical protein
MLTLKRRRKRRVPPKRGRGAISGPFFCCAQCNTATVAVSSGSAVLWRCDCGAPRRAACCAACANTCTTSCRTLTDQLIGRRRSRKRHHYLVSLSSSSNSSSAKDTETAPTLSSSCSILVTPAMTEHTTLCDSSQAIANWAKVHPLSLATASSSSTKFRFRSVKNSSRLLLRPVRIIDQLCQDCPYDTAR